MLKYREGVPYAFMGVDSASFDEADVVVLPIPYEGTASYKAGQRFGPRMIINASCQTETFDSELKSEIVSKVKIHTALPLESNLSSPESMLKDVHYAARQVVASGKFLLALGGEHSISSGLAKAYAEKHKELTVLQIDAHADLRQEFEGTPYSHACVMRRIHDFGIRTVQVGIRSCSLEEHEYICEKKPAVFWAPFTKEQIPAILEACGRHVYLTIDADGFDPSILPATGTPVPGGLRWYESLELFRRLFSEREVVGMDFSELADLGGLDTRSADLAAALLYRLIGYKFRGRL